MNRSPSMSPALMVLLLAGCQDTLSADPFVSDADFLNALPRAEDHTLAVASGPDAARDLPPPPADDWPDLFGMSVEIASNLNGAILTCLLLVDAVVEYPPAYRSEHARHWGPVDADDDVTLALEMERLTDVYAWDFRAAATGSGSLPSLCAGEHDPGTVDLSRGTGTLDVWLDHWSAEDDTVGTLATSYDLTDGQLFRIDIQGLAGPNQRAEDGAYYFRRTRFDGGDFQYRTTLLIDGEVDAVLEVRTRWTASGAGRSDARVLSDEYPQPYHFSECFEAGGRAVWRWTDLGLGNQVGDPTRCVFETSAAVDQI